MKSQLDIRGHMEWLWKATNLHKRLARITELRKTYITSTHRLHEIRIKQSVKNQIHVQTHRPKPSTEICAHPRMTNASNINELCISRMFHQRLQFYMWKSAVLIKKMRVLFRLCVIKTNITSTNKV